MVNDRRAIFFLSTKDKCCVFPNTPEEVISQECSLNVMDIVADASSVRTITFAEYKDEIGLQDAVASVLLDPKNWHKTTCSAHPSATLFTLLRWYLLRTYGYDDQNLTLQRLQNKSIDICESFYKPAILSLPRRESFSCSDIMRWMGLPYDYTVSQDINCHRAISYLCQRL